MDYKEVLKKLESLKSVKHAEGMMRFGITPKTKVYGISVPILRSLAKQIGKNHQLALRLFDSGIHESRLLASFIEDPKKVTQKQFFDWINTFDSWDICDQVCGNVFDKTKFASYKYILSLSKSKPEFVKRTAFVLMATMAVHRKELQDEDFIRFFPLIKKGSVDERNFVKKAVNWALRQIGKRNDSLHKQALRLAQEIVTIENKSAKWIAKDAIRELESIRPPTQIKKKFVV